MSERQSIEDNTIPIVRYHRVCSSVLPSDGLSSRVLSDNQVGI
jgi:hypothetical protein